MSERRPRGLIAWFAANPVAANLLMLAILVGGALAAWQIKKEFLPETTFEQVVAAFEYPGASPEDVELQILRRVEAAVGGIAGVNKIVSNAEEGAGSTTLTIDYGSSPQKVLEEVKRAIDGLETLPEGLKKPRVYQEEIKAEAMWLILAGDIDERSMKGLAEAMRDEMRALPQLGAVEAQGVREAEIAIEIDDATLERHRLTMNEVAEAVRRSSVDQPLGTIRAEGGDILLRAKGEAKSAADYAAIVVRAGSDGTVLRVGDLGRVIDGFTESQWFLTHQGKRAVGIQVFATGKQSLLTVAEAVYDYVEKKRKTLPPGITITIVGDTAKPLTQRLRMMAGNMASGALLVFLVVGLFLHPRLAVWVVADLPVCFLGALFCMTLPFFDYSLNMLTLFGFILVLGILVDDSIVIAESVFSVAESKGGGVAQVLAGARRVALPATFGVLTNIAAYLPIFMLPGAVGKLGVTIAWVVVICYLFSLLESKCILPAHLAHLDWQRVADKTSRINRLQAKAARGLSWFVDRLYRPVLGYGLQHRYALVALFLGLVIVSVGALRSGVIRSTFSLELESDVVEAELVMTAGTPFSVTREMAARVEEAASRANLALRQRHGLQEDVITSLIAFSTSRHEVWFHAELMPPEDRPVSSKEIVTAWRKECGTIPGALRLVFSGNEEKARRPLEYYLSGRNEEEMVRAAGRLKARLADYKGVGDIRDSHNPGNRELLILPRPGLEGLQLRLDQVAQQVHHGFYGVKAQTVQRGGESVDVYVRYPEVERREEQTLARMHLTAEGGENLAFADAATTAEARGAAELTRINRQRVITVQADIDPQITEPEVIIAEIENTILPEVQAEFPGVRCRAAGMVEEQSESMAILKRYGVLALFLIYALMAVPLKSYTQPMLIMTAIPFGMVGAVWGHWLLGLPVSMLSLCGIVALCGVVVNDGLVLVTFLNEKRRAGIPLGEAVAAAGITRARAIFLTSCTTFVGLLPMISERSLEAQFIIPMAVSLGFGMLFSTAITLLLLPALCLIVADLGILFRGWGVSRSGAVMPAVEPPAGANGA